MDFITILALIVASMLKYSAPLIFTSIGGTFSERGGIVNVGLEGIMVIGAFAGVLFNLNFADSFGNAAPWIAFSLVQVKHQLSVITLKLYLSPS